MSPEQQLAEGIAALGLEIDAPTREQLLAYARMIAKWNRVYNLTAIRSEAEIISLHLLDSLTVLPYIGSGPLADIGSGAGLPGIVLAITRPELEVHTVDTVQKKATFMRQAGIELKLPALQAHHVRVEQWQPAQLFPAIISRAFSELSDFIELTRHLLAPGGRWLAMKGVYPSDEIARLPQDVRLVESIPLRLPGAADVQRHLIVLERS